MPLTAGPQGPSVPDTARQPHGQAGKPFFQDPGMLQIWDPDGKPGAFCPLKGTDVQVDIAGFGARVTVRQTFSNPSKTPIEALYTFPLPADAAVDQMRFTVGSRIIEGQIKRREEARRIYEAAKNAGQAAALLDQERPNIFTQQVANIMPGQEVRVEISYVQILKFADDWFEFSFPMVVGPRFLGNAPDPGQIAPPIVAEGKRTGANIRLHVNLDAGAEIGKVQSVLHEIVTKGVGRGQAAIDLAKKDEIPNRDFILRYQLAGHGVREALFTHADAQKGGFFTLVLMPPSHEDAPQYVAPKEMVFVIDQSGSQTGFPIEKSKELARRMLTIMRPDDTFNVLGFSNTVNPLWTKSLPNDPENRKAALQFVEGLQANGGTQLNAAINWAMDLPPDPKRLRIIVFNSDGFVGDDFSILSSIQKNIGDSRIFTFGIGNSVNRFLIDGMSAEGRGDSEIVTLAADADKAVSRFAERLNDPVLTDIGLQIKGVPVQDVLPSKIPDVFSNKPVVIKGRYTQPGKAIFRLTGKVGGKPWSRDIALDFPKDDQHGSAVSSIWAREMVDEISRTDWMAQARGRSEANLGGLNRPDPKNTEERIAALALKFGIMTQYTSFVAVESRVVNVGGRQITIKVPVEMADGVSYEGTLGTEKGKAGFVSYSPMSNSIVVSGNTRSGGVGGGGGYGGGGYGGGGFGSGGGAAPPAAAGSVGAAPVRRLKTGALSKDALTETLARMSPKDLKARFDEMTGDDIAALSGLSGEDEERLLKELSPAQKDRFYRLTRLDKTLWKTQSGKAAVQIWVRKWDPALPGKLKANGAAIHLADSTLKVIFATVDGKQLTAIAASPGVVKIKPLEG